MKSNHLSHIQLRLNNLDLLLNQMHCRCIKEAVWRRSDRTVCSFCASRSRSRPNGLEVRCDCCAMRRHRFLFSKIFFSFGRHFFRFGRHFSPFARSSFLFARSRLTCRRCFSIFWSSCSFLCSNFSKMTSNCFKIFPSCFLSTRPFSRPGCLRFTDYRLEFTV